MMSAKKSIRAGLLIAAALVLLFVAFKSPGEAQKMEEADDIIVSQEESFCAGDLVLKLSDAGGYPIYYTLDGSIPGFESGFYEDPLVLRLQMRCEAACSVPVLMMRVPENGAICLQELIFMRTAWRH